MNNLGQRTSVVQSRTAFGASPPQWQWAYDSIGQVTTAGRFVNSRNIVYTYNKKRQRAGGVSDKRHRIAGAAQERRVGLSSQYGPFGETTAATFSHAHLFKHRFSTKPLGAETGYYYYGYHYYDPLSGRWLSRDPIGERGGLNLYGMVGNDGLERVDVLGRHPGDTMDYNYDSAVDDGYTNEERYLRDVLSATSTAWYVAEYNFASNLLAHFLKKHGGKYEPTEADIEEINEHGGDKICKIISQYACEKRKGEASLQIELRPKDANDSNIRWYFMVDNANMFYAYGGARLMATGCAVFGESSAFAISLVDKYEFAKDDDGWGDKVKELASVFVSSLLRGSYGSALALERDHDYKTFDHEADFAINCNIEDCE